MYEHLLLRNTDVEFIEGTLPHLRGWLFPEAAYMTCHLIRTQTAKGIKGPGFEIGVYEGRYLALIHRLLLERSEQTVGLDTFEFISQRDVLAKLAAIVGATPNLALESGDSGAISAERVRKWCRTSPSFISIDGDHSAAAVHRDLVLAESVLGPGGLVGVDDFLNHFALGVTEGVYAYLGNRDARLVPCLFIGQKLFMTRAEDVDLYQAAAFQFGTEAQLRVCEVFRSYLRRARAYVEPSICGHKILMFASPHCDATYGNA